MSLRLAHAFTGGAGLGVVALIQSAAVPSIGCSTHDCDQTCVAFYGADVPSSPPGEAPSCAPATPPQRDDAYLDGNTVVWESNPFAGEWLPYVGGAWLLVSWKKTVGDLLHGTQFAGWSLVPSEIDPYVSTVQQPTPTTVLVPTGDQLTQMSNIGPDGLWLNNASCANYYVRVVVRLQLVAPDAATR